MNVSHDQPAHIVSHLHSILPALGIAEEDDVVEGEPRIQTEEKDEDEFDEDADAHDVELAERQNDLQQFDDVDLAAPADYEPRLVGSHMVLL
jgi:hypothetical protein